VSAIVVNTDAWPIVRVNWHGQQTDEDLENYFQATYAYNRRDQPFVVITWVHSYKNSAGHREKTARFIADTDAATRKNCVAGAMIHTSGALRFVLSTIFLVKPLPMPYTVVSSLPEALRFLKGHAVKRRLTLPATVQWF